MKIEQSFLDNAVRKLNVSEVENVSSLLRQMHEFVIGNIFAQFEKDSMFYKKTVIDLLRDTLTEEVYLMQAANYELLRKEVFVKNQVSIRLLLMGWYYERGFEFEEIDRHTVNTFCASHINFGTVDTTV